MVESLTLSRKEGDLTLFRHVCIVAAVLYVLAGISGCSASDKPTAGSDTSAPPDQIGVPSEVSSQTPEPESTSGQAAQPVCDAVQAGSPAVPAVGPYADLLKLKPTELEERLGRPTSVKQDGSLTHWRYEELGLVFQVSNGWVQGLIQTKGNVTTALRIGASEADVTAIAGQLEAGFGGFKVARVYADDCTLELYVANGQLVRAYVTHTGRDN